jgi:hypothetical protein
LERIVFDEYDLRITSQAWIFFPICRGRVGKSGTAYTYSGNFGYVLLLFPMGRIADRVPANLGFKAPHSDPTSSKDNRAPLLALRLGACHASLRSVGEEADKLACIRALALPADLFADLQSKVLPAYRRRVAAQDLHELRHHPAAGKPNWLERMGASERRAMTPLFWGHVNPYGTFKLDMTARLPLDPPMLAASAGQLPLLGA